MPADLEAFAAAMVGTPFLHRGRTREGLDCWGLVVLAYRELYGIELAGHGDVDGSWEGRVEAAETARAEAAGWLQVEDGSERPGDVVMLRRGGRPLHVGIVLGHGRMIHADEPCAAVESYRGIKWRNRLLGFFRHPKAPA